MYYIGLRSKTVHFSQVNVTVNSHFYLAIFRTGRFERILAYTVYCTWYKNIRKLHEVIGKYTRSYMIHDSFLVYTKTWKIDFVKHFQTCSSRYISIYLLSLVKFQFSFFNTFSTRFFQSSCEALAKTCKIMHYSWRIFQDLTKNDKHWKILADRPFLARFLADFCKNYVVCKVLERIISSARILHEINFLQESLKTYLRESCKICFSTHLGDTW